MTEYNQTSEDLIQLFFCTLEDESMDACGELAEEMIDEDGLDEQLVYESLQTATELFSSHAY